MKQLLLYVSLIAFSPDDKHIAWATDDFSSSTHVDQAAMMTYRASDSVLLKTFTPAIGEVDEIAYAKDGRTLVAVGQLAVIDPTTGIETWTPTAEIWDPVAAVRKTSIKTKLSYIQAVRFSPNGQSIAYVEATSTIRIANAATGAILRTYTVAANEYVNSLAFSKDSSQLVIARTNGLYLYGAAASSVRQLSNISCGNVAFAAGRSLMVTSRYYSDPKTKKDEQIVEGWDAGTYKKIGQFTANFPSGCNLAVSADGTRVALCGQTQAIVHQGNFYHGIVGIWNAADGKELGSSDITAAADEQLAATDLSFSPDGKTLAVSYGDNNLNDDTVNGAVRIFDASNGHLKTTLVTTDDLASVRCSADGSKLIPCGYHQTADTGTQTGSLTIRRTQDNAVVAGYTDDLGTGVNFFALNEAQDLIVVTQSDSTISTLNCSGI